MGQKDGRMNTADKNGKEKGNKNRKGFLGC
jgi:hypothetical protein